VTPEPIAGRAQRSWPRTRAFLATVILIFFAPLAAFVPLFGSFFLPTDLGIAFCGVISAAAAVLAVSFTAPASNRGRFAVAAAIVNIACQALAIRFFLHESLLRFAVPAIVIAALALRLNRHAAGRRDWISRAATITLALYPAFLIAVFVDWPARQASIPPELLDAAGGTRASITRFSSYRLPSFIDSEELWRIDAAPDHLQSIAIKLRMGPCAAAPARFWGMPPYYWPTKLPDGATLFCTPAFPGENRGPDGDHYFMLLDVRRARASVWYKNNF